MRFSKRNAVAALLAPVVLIVAGCGGRVSASGAGPVASLSIHAAAVQIDTNGTTRYSATKSDGQPVKVLWSVSGGDSHAGPGRISADGLYTPPSYLTEESVTVQVNAVAEGDAALLSDSARLTVTPGFLQPLTPGNLALGPNGTVTISGSMTEVGGGGGIRFALASDADGTAGAAGTLSETHCVRGSVKGANPAYTVCSVAYTAPAAIPSSGSVFVVGTITGPAGSTPARSWVRVLLNSAGITSNPASHQVRLSVPVQLGSSSGNNSDYDASLGQLSDCCGGTLGALVQDASGTQYVLSNNHVLARSDQSIPGETVIQPGLIDNGCTPYGVGPGTTPVATLTGYPSLRSPATNVDAAVARVSPGAVDPKGSILELGAKQADGTLAAAPPGVSSTNGKGESALLGMKVAKSGRTTGLTCAAVSALNVDVMVDYFTDCAETRHAFTKTFSNQIAIAGTSFSDAGDSGALVVNSANAEPVGLFFAGGTDIHGVEQAIANPVADVLAALDSQIQGTSGPTSYAFVGGQDHAVTCLNYGGEKSFAKGEEQAAGLSASERERAEAALPLAQQLLNPATGIVRVGITASLDHPGEAAIALYVEPIAYTGGITIPATISGLPTVVVSASPETATTVAQPRASSLAAVLAAKQRNAASLLHSGIQTGLLSRLKSDTGVFGVGIGQSLDNPNDAALVIFVDRKTTAVTLPVTIDSQRVRVVMMDRLHVTRSHGYPVPGAGSCTSSQRRNAVESDSEFLSFPSDSLQMPE